MGNIIGRIVIAVTVVHGAMHGLGVVKGFGWAEVAALRDPVSPMMAGAWLLSGLLVLAVAVAMARRLDAWWTLAAAAAVASQAVITTSWVDAKAGSVANALLLVTATHGWLAYGPRSTRAEFRRHVGQRFTPVEAPELVREHDLERLPELVARYVRRSGAVGRPRVHNVHAHIHGRIRAGADEPWMTFIGEQVNTFGPDPTRVFFIDATMSGLPVDVLHVYEHRHASMRVKLLSLLPLANARGTEMDRAETVTVFNDMCVLAPAALVDAPIAWSVIDEHRVSGRYSNDTISVTAVVEFAEDGRLVDFVSDDRVRNDQHAGIVPERWSTPFGREASFGGRRISSFGEGRWHPPGGPFTYLEFNLDDLAENGQPTHRVPAATSSVDAPA